MRFTLSLHPFSVNDRSFVFPLKVTGRRTGKKRVIRCSFQVPAYTDFSHPCPMSMSGRTSVISKFTTAVIMFAACSPATFATSAL